MAEFAMNTTYQASTGYTPFFLLYGRQPITPLSLAVPQQREDDIPRLVLDLHQALDAAQQAMERTAEAMKRTMDAKK